jgi:hypothetical protein
MNPQLRCRGFVDSGEEEVFTCQSMILHILMHRRFKDRRLPARKVQEREHDTLENINSMVIE